MFPYFVSKTIESQRGRVTCARLHSQKLPKRCFKLELRKQSFRIMPRKELILREEVD